MSPKGTTPHTMSQAGWPDPNMQSTLLTTAIRIVHMYQGGVPTADRIRIDFNVSRATAYRWRRALKDAMPLEKST